MRLFVAVEIAPDIREKIISFIEKVRPDIASARWVRPEGLHITVKFLGNVADESRAAIEGALGRVKATSFSLAVQGVGVFPNARSPRVLWVGIESGPELGHLAAEVDKTMAPLGFEREKRAFTPHVTLARFNDPRRVSVSSALSAPDASFGRMTATQFHLYESHLSPQGSRYAKLASFALEGDASVR